MDTPRFTVSDFIVIANQTLDYAFPAVEVEGEVASFKISKNRWVFFDLKDEQGTINCFMTIYNLKTPLEDGMKIVVRATPKLTNFSRFSLTIQKYQPLGSGNIKKAFDALKAKLEQEGLFDPAKKRPLPDNLTTIGVISSVTAAGYADFLKILDNRWGGLTLKVANCGVQGLSASEEIIRALDYFNTHEPVDIIAILRGGGSKDDLAVFNDEDLTRKIASSKIPIITGIGHEVDLSLADLAADIRAATPTNAAELLTRDKTAELARLHNNLQSLATFLAHYLDTLKSTNSASLTSVSRTIEARIESAQNNLKNSQKILNSLNPESVLKQGYAILTGNLSPGSVVKITTCNKLIQAKVENVHQRKNH
ncbi:exodeoxyribonuclease VII large subunit [Candidatus Saccharibacteria bacterium]|nr:exodeoxyribonuclease VII large subunit [Candidatus Saccharibacteria bacterium]